MRVEATLYLSRRLNPFEFRAGIYCGQCTRPGGQPGVLIPLNSGLVFTVMVLIRAQGLIIVLIPLNSGLVFTDLDWINRVHMASLNPFEFRAGIY